MGCVATVPLWATGVRDAEIRCPGATDWSTLDLVKRVPTWVWWTVGIAAAGGVGWLILRPSPAAAAPDGTHPPPLPPPPGGSWVGTLEPDPEPEPLPGLDGYTSFFTPESEHLVVGALESWKLENGVGACTGVDVWDDQAQTMLIDHFEEVRAAALAVLNEHYPLQGGGSWDVHAAGQPEWATWLFARVEVLAERVVCGFQPVG